MCDKVIMDGEDITTQIVGDGTCTCPFTSEEIFAKIIEYLFETEDLEGRSGWGYNIGKDEFDFVVEKV